MANEPEQQRLLMEIKGDLGETYGIVSEVRTQLAEHRQEDRERLDKIDGRLVTIEERQAEAIGAARARERGEVRQAGMVAAMIAGAISLLGQFVAHWWPGR
jgi:hypothetical protein